MVWVGVGCCGARKLRSALAGCIVLMESKNKTAKSAVLKIFVFMNDFKLSVPLVVDLPCAFMVDLNIVARTAVEAVFVPTERSSNSVVIAEVQHFAVMAGTNDLAKNVVDLQYVNTKSCTGSLRRRWK